MPLVSSSLQPLLGEQSVGIAHAAEKEKPKRSTRKTPAIRAKIYEKLNAAQEAALSRLYGGIHYRAAIENGLDQGINLGKHVVNTLNVKAL